MYYTYYTYIYIIYRYDIYVSEESWAAASQSPGQSPSAVLSPSVGSPHHSEPEPEQSAQQLQAALGECWWFGDLGGTLCKTGALEMKSTWIRSVTCGYLRNIHEHHEHSVYFPYIPLAPRMALQSASLLVLWPCKARRCWSYPQWYLHPLGEADCRDGWALTNTGGGVWVKPNFRNLDSG